MRRSLGPGLRASASMDAATIAERERKAAECRVASVARLQCGRNVRRALLHRADPRCALWNARGPRPPNPDPLEQGRAMRILVRLRGVAVDRRPLCVGIALQFHHLIVTFRGGRIPASCPSLNSGRNIPQRTLLATALSEFSAPCAGRTKLTKASARSVQVLPPRRRRMCSVRQKHDENQIRPDPRPRPA